MRIVDDERPGPLDVITNPFHIVTVARECIPDGANVSFRHLAPRPDLGVVRGRVFVPTDAIDWRGLPGARVQLLSADGSSRFAPTGLDWASSPVATCWAWTSRPTSPGRSS